MAQQYHSPVQHERMEHGLCPECGDAVEAHSGDPRFWMPRACDLTLQGVQERVAQYRSDRAIPPATKVEARP